MTEKEIMEEIEKKGFFHLDRENEEMYNASWSSTWQLMRDYVIQSLKKANITFPNASCIYIKFGNPDRVHVVSKKLNSGTLSWLKEGY